MTIRVLSPSDGAFRVYCTILGRGSAVGFDPPESLPYDEPRLCVPFTKYIMKRAQQRITNCMSSGAADSVKHWCSALTRRLFLLHSIHSSEVGSQANERKISSHCSIVNEEELQSSSSFDDAFLSSSGISDTNSTDSSSAR